jgi:hypothetical protein
MVALVALVSGAFAGTPVFTGIPGVITISDSETGIMEYSDVFVFDDAISDPDGDDASIDWGFTENVGSTGLAFEVNGLASGSSGLSAASPNFSIAEVGAGAGQTPEAAAYGNLALANAATIAVTATDASDNVATKEVLVNVGAGADSADIWMAAVAGPTASPLAGWSDADMGPNAPFVQDGGVDFANDSDGYAVIGQAGAGLDDLGVGSVLSPYPDWVMVQAGKIYRVSAEVQHVGISTPTAALYTSIIAGQGADGGFGVQAILEVFNGDFTQAQLAGYPSATSYEVIYDPPQAARLSGITYDGSSTSSLSVTLRGIDFGANWHSDIANFVPDQQSGAAVFSNIRVDEIDRPAVGMGLQEALWDVDTDFAPTGSLPNQVTATEAPGWKEKAFGWSFGTTGGQPDPTRAFDNGTPGSAAVALNADDFTVTSELAGNFYVSCINGDPNVLAGDTTDTSCIPIADVIAKGSGVYYRAAYSISASDDDVANNPNFRIRLGNPWNIYDNALTVGDSAAASAISSSATEYVVWAKGVGQHDATQDFNNLMTGLDLIDATDTVGGETYTIDSVLLESYPVGLF